MQSLQCVQSIQAIQILEQPSLCTTAKRRRGHLPIPKQEKDSSSTSQQETRVMFSTILAHATKISSKHVEKELLHCTSLGYRDIQCTHSHPEHHPLPVSLDPFLILSSGGVAHPFVSSRRNSFTISVTCLGSASHVKPLRPPSADLPWIQ